MRLAAFFPLVSSQVCRHEQFQADEPNLVIGGMLSMISPVSDTVK
jgi:hypothetical protein